MVKLMVCVKPNTDIDVEEVHQSWRTSRGELIQRIPGSRKYVRKNIQSRTVPRAYERNGASFDGVAELWFDDMAADDGFFADLGCIVKVRPDELKFTDHTNLAWFVTQEEPVIEGYPLPS